jgi:hypothetical protein
MIRIAFLFSISFICLGCLNLQAQVPPIIKKLFSINGTVQIFHITSTQWTELSDLPLNFKNSNHRLIKTSKGLFLSVDGTGRIYKVEQKGNGLHFKRNDSTYFTGYNLGNLLFNMNDSIYSFGGEGFWYTNGDLRVYDDSITHEWHALKLNKIIPGLFSLIDPEFQFHFLDTLHQKLIITGNNFAQSHILKTQLIDSSNKNSLFELDLKTNNWAQLGTKNFGPISEFALTPYGILTHDLVIDILNNKKYSLVTNLERSSMFGRSSLKNIVSIAFCIDSTVYFGNNKDLFDSLIINRSSLKDTGEPAYFPKSPEPILSKDEILTYSLIATSSLSLFLIFLNFKKRKSHHDKPELLEKKSAENLPANYSAKNAGEIENNTIYRSGKLVELMNEQEISFLKYLYDHSNDQRLTTIDEINKKLGTYNKSIEIQKKMRSDMINGINDKLAVFSKSPKPVIDKQRSDFDKRSFEYFIDSDNMELVEKITKVNGK